jgi:glycosyltransferase involved in cell wall biosynthesis
MRNVAVIIPTYNYGRFIEAAIESALRQTLRPSEVIVVDDGSTDETAEIVNTFGDQLRYIRQANLGVSAARNRGVAESQGDLLAFLDADDTWEPDKLEKQTAKFESDPAVGLAHCGMREFASESGETVDVRIRGMEGWLADELLLWERPAVTVSGSAIMVRRTAFEEVKGFDTRLACGEDWDLCYRIARNYRVGFVPEPLVNYRSHPRAAHLNVKAMEQGMEVFYQKAFAQDPGKLKLRRRALGNCNRILAASYFHAGHYMDFIRTALKSVWYRPAGLAYLAAFPIRKIRDQEEEGPSGSSN